MADIYGDLGINNPPEQPASKRKFIEDLLQNLVFSLGQGYSAQAGARGPQARAAGIGAAIQGPMVLQQIRQKQQEDAQDRQIKIAQLKQAALRGDQEAVLRLREAIGNPVAPTDSVTTTGLPIPVTMDTDMPIPPLKYPLGNGQSVNVPITSAQDAMRSRLGEEQTKMLLQQQAQQNAPFTLSPGQQRVVNGRVVASAPANVPAPKEPTYSPENVMVDGKAAHVLRDNSGNYVDANTKAPITGRITPYIVPPTPRAKGEITPTAEANLIQQLNKQWEKASSDVQSLYRANAIMDAGMAAAKKGDMNAGSQAVLVTFQKFLDPTSVVRESEYARSGAGLSMQARIRGAVEKLEKGGAGVTLDELQKFADLAKEINSKLAAEGNSLLSSEKNRITATAGRYNIPAELVIPKFDFTPNTPPQQGGMITITSPDGKETRDVPASELQYWLDKGAKVKPRG